MKAGKWGRRMIVSVAFSPTPATSTMGRTSTIDTLYEKMAQEQEKRVEGTAARNLLETDVNVR